MGSSSKEQEILTNWFSPFSALWSIAGSLGMRLGLDFGPRSTRLARNGQDWVDSPSRLCTVVEGTSQKSLRPSYWKKG